MSKMTNHLNRAPKHVTIAQSGHVLPGDSSRPAKALVEETSRARSKLEGMADEDRKECAQQLTAQLSRSKHGTA